MAARVRLIVAWLAFAAWVGWLGWQSWRFGRFPVVSRAQFANATVAVLARIESDRDGRAVPSIRVTRAVWPANGARPDVTGELVVTNLAECESFTGPGDYVVPLSRGPDGAFLVARVGRSPLIEPRKHRPTIYPAIPLVLRQLEDIPPNDPRNPRGPAANSTGP